MANWLKTLLLAAADREENGNGAAAPLLDQLRAKLSFDVLLWIYMGSAAVMIVLALPLLLRRVPPNGLYGFRVRRTLERPELWYDANAYSARWLIVVGLVTAAAGIGLRYVPNIGLDAYAVSVAAIIGLTLLVAMGMMFRYLRRWSPAPKVAPNDVPTVGPSAGPEASPTISASGPGE